MNTPQMGQPVSSVMQKIAENESGDLHSQSEIYKQIFHKSDLNPKNENNFFRDVRHGIR